jgi:DNA-binding transcriptional ArsR family regulator
MAFWLPCAGKRRAVSSRTTQQRYHRPRAQTGFRRQ